jgi:hypothetical protein
MPCLAGAPDDHTLHETLPLSNGRYARFSLPAATVCEVMSSAPPCDAAERNETDDGSVQLVIALYQTNVHGAASSSATATPVASIRMYHCGKQLQVNASNTPIAMRLQLGVVIIPASEALINSAIFECSPPPGLPPPRFPPPPFSPDLAPILPPPSPTPPSPPPSPPPPSPPPRSMSPPPPPNPSHLGAPDNRGVERESVTFYGGDATTFCSISHLTDFTALMLQGFPDPPPPPPGEPPPASPSPPPSPAGPPIILLPPPQADAGIIIGVLTILLFFNWSSVAVHRRWVLLMRRGWDGDWKIIVTCGLCRRRKIDPDASPQKPARSRFAFRKINCDHMACPRCHRS